MKNYILFIVGLFFISSNSHAQTDSLKVKIEKAIEGKNAQIGISIIGIEDPYELEINGNINYPMLSVFKFHVALAVLHKVDHGTLELKQEFFINESELLPNTWSPMKKDYPEGNVTLSLEELLQYMITLSDNNACDILLRMLGGTEPLQNYIKQLGIQNISIKVNEEEMHQAWEFQYSNTTSPLAGTKLLKDFFEGKILHKESRDYLYKIMLATSTGANRIKGQLPANANVAHRTGASFTNQEGLTAATNDMGIVALPNGKHFVICVFVSDSYEDKTINEKIISDVAKLSWDFFAK